jgi:GGDEF domain-containing protein
MGQRLTGWVAANRQTILNSDPMLDLGEVARALRPPLRSCLSTPLLSQNNLIGVLTAYSTNRDAFTEDHRRIVEVVARQVSQTLERALDYKREQAEQLRDQFTGLPNRQHLERFIVSEMSASEGLPCSIVLVSISVTRSPRSSNTTIPQVASVMRTVLRGGDLLFTYETDTFVALLTHTSAQTADAVARKIGADLKRPNEDGSFVLRIGRATAPEDGTCLSDLVRAAESRQVVNPQPNRPSIH